MTLCILSLASQMSILTTALVIWAVTIWVSPVNKNKLTWTISDNHKVSINFHHDAPNIHVPGFNFLEFLVNDLSKRGHGKSAKHTCM